MERTAPARAHEHGLDVVAAPSEQRPRVVEQSVELSEIAAISVDKAVDMLDIVLLCGLYSVAPDRSDNPRIRTPSKVSSC